MHSFVRTLEDSVTGFGTWAEAALPKLLAAFLILLIGWIVAKALKTGLVKALGMMKLDVLAEKAGVNAFLKKGNIHGGSIGVAGNLIYWLLLLLTILMAVSALGITEARSVFDDVVHIIPGVIVAVVILILGLSFSGFISDIVQTAAINTGFRQARLLANTARYTITIFVLILALNQLDIDTQILSNAFLILFAAICLAAALAFGLGCRDLAGRIAEDIWSREQAAAKALGEANAPEPATEEA